MKDRIYITHDDMEKLRGLIEARAAGHWRDLDALTRLEEELDRAEVRDVSHLPPGVVTMNSSVRLRDLDTGREQVYRLVFPNQAGGEGTVSVLAPLGTALLGYRAGDRIDWPVPRGMRRLCVIEVLQQPEFARSARG